MIGAPNSLNLNCKVRVMKEAPGPLVSEEIADIFTNYDIDTHENYAREHYTTCYIEMLYRSRKTSPPQTHL